MKEYRLIVALLCGLTLTACGGNDTVELECDGGERYQDRTVGKRVAVPDGMDSLDEFNEMPIPKADPEAAKTVPGRCADMPPPISTSG